MKLTMIITFLFGCVFFTLNSFAEGEMSKVTEKKEQNQSTEKKKRRKKVQMCQECGKPETECDCEGEGHGVEGHDHEHEEKDNE